MTGRTSTSPSRNRRPDTLSVAATLLAGVVLFLATTASAGQTGREFLELCASDGPWTEGYCTGYIVGAGELIDGLLLEEELRARLEGKAFCLPDDLKRGEVRDLVLAYLRKRPDAQDKHMASITWAALIEAFPCD